MKKAIVLGALTGAFLALTPIVTQRGTLGPIPHFVSSIAVADVNEITLTPLDTLGAAAPSPVPATPVQAPAAIADQPGCFYFYPTPEGAPARVICFPDNQLEMPWGSKPPAVTYEVIPHAP